MGTHYGNTVDRHWLYTSADALGTDYATHAGEEVFLFGTVERIDSDTADIAVSHTGGMFTVTVGELDAVVRPGGVVQVVWGNFDPTGR